MKQHNRHKLAFVTNARIHENGFEVEIAVASDMGLIAWTSEPYSDRDYDNLPHNMHGLYIDRRRGGNNLFEFWREVQRRKAI